MQKLFAAICTQTCSDSYNSTCVMEIKQKNTTDKRGT